MKTHLLFKSALLISCTLGTISSTTYSQSQTFSYGPTNPTEKSFDKKAFDLNRAEEIKILQTGNSQRDIDDSTYIIPIVFHIIHEYGAENISDAQVKDAVRILNEDYQKLNADTTAVSTTFQPIMGEANLEFRLAQKDPFGNCTNGIERIYSQETNIGDDGSKMHPWPRGKYLNVWVVKTMENGVAGYAYYPSATTQGYGAYIDGVIILSNYIGSIGTGNPSRARALTHEIGHYLALPHTWGSTNDPGVACGDDGINDTPVTKGWDHCATSGLDFCNPGIEENIHNYMEYSYCSHMFTKDQVAGMRAVLNLPTALRNNLWSASNLVETGVDLGTTLCEPTADFSPSQKRICTGQSVTLFDNSYNGDVATWSWSIPGGTPSTSSLQNPSVTFSNAGWQSITLTVTNASGTSTHSIQNAIVVSEDYDTYTGLATETFESYSTGNIGNSYGSETAGYENEEIPSVIINGGTVNVGNWQLATDAGYSGSKSMHLDAHETNNKMIDEFVTPRFDLTYVTAAQLTFKYAAAAGTSTVDDITESLKVYASTNCGQTWQYRGQVTGLDMITAGFDGGAFKPSSLSQWNTKSISLPGSLSQANVRFKFEYTSGVSSNDFYIDDIAIEGVLGVDNNIAYSNSIVYPNPSSSISEVIMNITSDASEEVTIQLFSSMGQLISSKSSVTLLQGENQLKLAEIGFEEVSTGIYYLKIQGSSKLITTERIIIQK